MEVSKNQLKYIKSLHISKFRQKYENFIAEGDKVVLPLLQSHAFELELIVATSSWIEANAKEISPFMDKTLVAEEYHLAQISTLKTASDVLIVSKKKNINAKNLLNKSGIVLYLDGVQDPGNMGTIIRIADWFGASGVLASEDSVDFYHPKVVMASMASIAGVDFATCTRQELIANKHQTKEILLLDMNGQDLNKHHFLESGIIIFGSEGHGISDELKNGLGHYAKALSIKGNESRIAESLNVGISAGIVLDKIFNRS
jgi:RNA methyltransferase, TrmH family